jgi:hypothetical protein
MLLSILAVVALIFGITMNESKIAKQQAHSSRMRY